MLRCLSLTAVVLCLPLLAKVPLQPVQVTKTDHVEFAPGGTIRVSGSTGQLDVEGWDRPEVEITVAKSTYRGGSAKDREKATTFLDLFRVSAEKKGAGELVISTAYPSRKITRLFRGKTDVNLEYHIKVPRDSHLVIRHDSGDVRLYDLTGEIDATSGEGDMVVLLPESGKYAIDAKCTVGGVYSDFAGNRGTPWAVGERFVEATPAPASRVYLRVGLGGIQILKMSPK
jgi:hypothetical protein